MKITKQEGMACIRALQMLSDDPLAHSIPVLLPRDEAFGAVFSMANDDDSCPNDIHERRNFHMLALAMCAAIAGVKP